LTVFGKRKKSLAPAETRSSGPPCPQLGVTPTPFRTVHTYSVSNKIHTRDRFRHVTTMQNIKLLLHGVCSRERKFRSSTMPPAVSLPPAAYFPMLTFIHLASLFRNVCSDNLMINFASEALWPWCHGPMGFRGEETVGMEWEAKCFVTPTICDPILPRCPHSLSATMRVVSTLSYRDV